jgi:segregation and condensation protein A
LYVGLSLNFPPMDYCVQTDVYNGPMDLLLYLIRREEVDIYDIPVARITEQYCRFVETLGAIDPNIAGDFLVMAATLMELKSRMLLPRAPAEEESPEDLGDPRLELVRQLLEYKKFKDASFELDAAAQTQAMRWSRIPAKGGVPKAGAVDLDDVQIWDLVAAFNKLMSSIGAKAATHDVLFDDTPIALHATDILDRLVAEARDLPFEDIFVGRNKVEMIGLFLAMLELIRQKRIKIVQDRVHGPINITLLSAEPITIGEEWESAKPAGDDEPEAAMSAVKDETESESLALVTDDDEVDAEEFSELDNIKTDINIEAILAEQSRPQEDDAQ